MSSSRWQLLVSLLTLANLANAEETVTGNLIDNYGWTESGGILNHYDHHHTDYTGGEVSQVIDISEYTGQTQYQYQTTVWGCNNSFGGYCSDPNGIQDTFVVSVVASNGDSWTDEFTLGYTTQEIDLTYTPTSDSEYVEITLYGIDEGYWAGWYGPTFYSGSFTVAYDPTLTEVIMPATNPELNTVLPSDPMNDPSMGMSVPDLGTPQVEIPQVQTVEASPTPQPQEAPSASPSQAPSQGPSPSSNVASNSPSNNGTSSSSSNKSSGKVSVKTAAGVVSTNIDVANASTESIGDAFGDPTSPVAQAVMVAVMASNGANLTEAKLIQPELPKPRTMRDRRFEDRFWLDSLRSEVRFQKHMVDKQWQN